MSSYVPVTTACSYSGWLVSRKYLVLLRGVTLRAAGLGGKHLILLPVLTMAMLPLG